MKSRYLVLIPVLFTSLLLGGCILAYEKDPPRAYAVPKYAPEESGKTKQLLRFSQIKCEEPGRWEWRDDNGGEIVCARQRNKYTVIWRAPLLYPYPYYGYWGGWYGPPYYGGWYGYGYGVRFW